MDNKRPGSNRPRRSSRHITTRSGRVLKVNRTWNERWKGTKEAKARRKVERLIGLPKSRLKRLMWRLQPRRLAVYWFSRDGGIMALKVTGIAILVLFVFTLGVFAFFRKDLPDITDISGDNLGGSISYYDRTGQTLLWQDYNAVKRVPVQSKDISHYIKDASVAVEDRDFYQHRGFDIRGISRAAFNDIFQRGATQGGSTITQQLVKLTQDWTQKRTFTRKVKEIILAVELERTYTKDQILTGYLNAAPYGGVDYGVQAAASDYFHKSAKDLTLPESAMLAAIPKSPAIYSPYSKEFFDKEAFIGRYGYVLDSMVRTGKITKKEAEDAKKHDVLAEVHPQQTKYAGIKSPYFLLAAKNELTARFIPSGNSASSGKVGGWKVITTMDMNLQALAEAQTQKGLAQVKRQGGDVATLAAEDVKTGQMVALVGGNDFTNPDYGKINYAQWPISPGSSFKPYDYVSLIENSNNAGAGSVLYDTVQPLPGYPCTNKARKTGNCLENYDFRSPGPLPIRYALGGSRNIPAVKSILIAGVDKTRSTAKAMMGPKGYGYNCFADQALTKSAPCYGAAGIGDGAYLHLDEHVHGFATISRNGLYVPQTYILKIYSSKSDSKPFYEWKARKDEQKQAVRPDSAYIVGNILSDPNASYFPAGQKIHRYKGWNFGLKTGTTNDAKDGLLMGFSSKYAVGVWVGYHTRQKNMSGFMENMTRPIWNGFMTGAHGNLQPENWTQPKGVQSLPAFVVRTHVGIGSVEPSPAMDLYPSWYKPKSGGSQSSTIDKVSNKLATNCTPPLARQTVSGNSNADQFSVDTFYGAGAAGSANTSASDDVHSCSDSPPTITLTVTDSGGGGSNVCNGSCTIAAFTSAGTHPFNNPSYAQFPGTVTISVNGQAVKTFSVADPQDNVSFTYNATSSGSGTVTAQITDSVLYSGSASATVNFTQGVGPLTLVSATAGGGVTTMTWTGGVGAYSVYRASGVGPVCSSSGASCSASGSNYVPPGIKVYVQDSTGTKSNQVTVSGS